MSTVLFSKKIDRLLDKIDFSQLKGKVAIKTHFGEEGCTTFIPPGIVRKVWKKCSEHASEAHLVDCNVLYRGSRTTRSEHVRTAEKHGFGFAPIRILDGEKGQNSISVKSCELGAGLEDYDSLVVLTHFKGHALTGLGGAIKNVGMGLGSRAGKLEMHSDISPSVNESECIACGACAEECPASAISVDGSATINSTKCIGCAMCIEVCPEGAVKIPWSGSPPKKVQEKICDYAKAALSLFDEALFINALVNVTKDCDCMSKEQEPLIEDVGYLYSEDIVKVDAASKELVRKKGFIKQRCERFQHMLDYAEKTGLGEKKNTIL